jgi:hypothetical protein
MVSATLTVATFASACVGGNPGGSSGTTGGANATLLTPHAKSVSVTLDSTKAATALIPVTGGTITATGADGSVFTLTIPDKALGGDEMITMTPLGAVNGLPFKGGLVAGVQLEPDGLELFQMATLTIKPAKAVPIAMQVAVSYHGTGDNLYMLPLDRVAGISMHILHFSGYSVASGITGEIEEQAKNPPTDAADQAAQQIAAEANAAIVALREAAQAGQPLSKEVADKLNGTMNRWFDQVVEAKVAAAQADYTLTDDAMDSAAAWLQMLQYLGSEDSHRAHVDRLTAQLEALKKAYEKALSDRCTSRHDVSAVLALIALERRYQLLGIKTSADPGPLDTVKKCLRFELDFETVSPFVTDGPAEYVLHDRVMKLVLQPDFPSGNLTASQPHEILSLTAHSDTVYRIDHPVSAKPFSVSNMSFHMHFVLRRKATSPPPITGVALTIDPGEVTADTYSAPFINPEPEISGGPTYHCESEQVDNLCWAGRHRGERAGATATTFIIRMDYVGTSLFARKTYDLPCNVLVFACSSGNEKTTFDLRHAPVG